MKGPFKELGILQKEMMMLRDKIEESNKTTVRYVTKKYHKRKTSVPKSLSRSSRNSLLHYQKGRSKVSELKVISARSQHDLFNVQACMGTNDFKASEAKKIQDLERARYDLDAKMKQFKRKTLTNQLRIKNYVKGIKEEAKNLQEDQDELREEVGNIFYSLEDEMSLLDDDMDVRLSNVESRVFDLIEAKLKAERRKRWCRKSIRII